MDIRKIAVGGMWESGGWEIHADHEVEIFGDIVPCKHCSPTWIKKTAVEDGRALETKVCTCPSVVVAYNEGGYATTGVCLHCIVEAANG